MFPHFAAHRPQSGRIFLLLANFGKEGRPEPIVGKFSQENAGGDDRYDSIARELFS
jgi:hypothetical protein